LETGEKYHPSSTQNKQRWEYGAVKLCSDPNILQGPYETSGWILEGVDLKGSAYTVGPIRKDMIVMSQWAHSPLNLESPEAASAWPVDMASQPAKQEEAEGRCPCLVWKTSQLSVA
jgi:hypothetical protein